jgi:hypothetical protein
LNKWELRKWQILGQFLAFLFPYILIHAPKVRKGYDIDAVLIERSLQDLGCGKLYKRCIYPEWYLLGGQNLSN